jgi:hypothetical protein
MLSRNDVFDMKATRNTRSVLLRVGGRTGPPEHPSGRFCVVKKELRFSLKQPNQGVGSNEGRQLFLF